MKRLPLLLATLVISTSTGFAFDLPSQPLKESSAPFPPLPFATSGAFFAPVGGSFVVPAPQDGGAVLWLSKGGSEWKTTGLRVPLAAAAVRWGDSWILAGGLVDGQPVHTVSRLDLKDGAPVLTTLPDLPVAVAHAGGAVIGKKLYVFGGAATPSGGKPSSALWILDLEKLSGWERGPELPAAGRSDFASVEQYGVLCLFGGLLGDGTRTRETWVYRPVPLEGTKEAGWKRMSDIPLVSSDEAAVPMGQAQVAVLCAGAKPLLFHTLTDAWCMLEGSLPSHGLIAAKSGTMILVAGENASGQAVAACLEPASVKRVLGWIDYAVIVVYFVLLSWIGVSFSGKQESSDEFSLGNRKVRWWAAGISMFATGASAISFMAIPALAFATNLVWLFPLLIFIPAFFVTAYLIFPLLRGLEITSTYEYLERRFNRTLRVIASLQCILFQTIAKASIVLVLPALAISSVTGINVYASVIIMGVITTIYTAVGGFEAVIWTEVFQAALMLFAPLAIIWIAVANLPGGIGDFFAIGSQYHKFEFALITWDVAVPAFWILMIMQFVTATVSVAGDQPIIQRVFSAPLNEVRRVNAMSTACGIIIGILVNVMGLAIFAYFHAHPAKFDPGAQNDQVVPMFVAQAMPVGAAGMVVAAIFAASMSTVASIMNSVATIFTEDFYMKLRPQATDRQRLFSLKVSSYAVGIIGTAVGLLFAGLNLKSMMVLWSQLGALLGGGIVGVYTLGMFTKRANGFGAICGAIISIVITVLVKFHTSLHWGTYAPIAILACIVFGYLFSLLGGKPANLAGLTVFTPAKTSK